MAAQEKARIARVSKMKEAMAADEAEIDEQIARQAKKKGKA
jgi:hypothetical protein